MFKNCKMYIDDKELTDVSISNFEITYRPEYAYNHDGIPLVSFMDYRSTIELEKASFDKELVKRMCESVEDSNEVDVTFKIPVQVRKHKKKRINKKWLKKYGVTMVEYTVKNARLEHNYITNT